MRLFLLGLMALALTACNDNDTYTGTMNTTSPLTLQTKDGPVVIPVGAADTILKFHSTGNVDFHVGGINVTVKLPSAARPKSDGSIQVSSSQLKQNFDIVGMTKVSVTQTGAYSSDESCIAGYHEGPEECDWESTPEVCDNHEECGTTATGESICKTRQSCHGGGMDYVCHRTSIPEYGSQTVERYDIVTTTQMELNFQTPSAGVVLSTFSGKSEKIQPKIISRGFCHH